MTGSSSTALSFHLPPHCLDLLQHLLVGQHALRHQHPAGGFLFVEAGAEEFLKGGYLPGIKFLGHIQLVANQLFYQSGSKTGSSLSRSIS